jgi:hypothetical protein
MLHEMAFFVWEENCMETGRDFKQFKKDSNNKKGQGHYLTLPLKKPAGYYAQFFIFVTLRLLACRCILLAKTI